MSFKGPKMMSLRGAKIHSKMTFSITTLSIMAFSIMTFSIMAFVIMTFRITTHSIMTAKWHSIVMLSVIYAESHLC